MSFFNQNNQLNTQLLSRCFYYQNIHMVPSVVKKATIFYAIKKNDINHVRKIAEMLELITKNRPALLRAKKASVPLKIRKGAPIGAKVSLRKKKLSDFLYEFVWEILSNINNYKPISIKFFQKEEKIPFVFKIQDSMIFSCLKKNYSTFKDFSELKILFSFEKKASVKENFFLSRLYKLPIQYKK